MCLKQGIVSFIISLITWAASGQHLYADLPKPDELHLIKARFYVAANGDDHNPGTTEKPFKTIERAQRAVRDLKLAPDPKGNWQYVIVSICSNLTLDKPIIFGPDDSAPDHTTICYASEDELSPAILSGFTKTTIEGNAELTSYELSELVRIQGTLEKPVRGIEFHRIDWNTCQMNWLMQEMDLPETAGGKSERISRSYLTGGAVSLYFARDIQFQNCDFHKMFGSGLSFGVGCQDCYVVGCKFYVIKQYAITIGDREIRQPTIAKLEAMSKHQDAPHTETDSKIPSRIQVQRCLFEFCDHGIFIGTANHTWIRNNVFRYLAYPAIEMGFDMKGKTTVCGYHLISENNIYRTPLKLGDAAIIVKDKQPDTIIRQNLIHDLFAEYPNGRIDPRIGYRRDLRTDTDYHAIKLDTATEGVLVENNTLFNMPNRPIWIATNGKNTFKNNRLISQRNAKGDVPAFKYASSPQRVHSNAPQPVKPDKPEDLTPINPDDTEKIDNFEVCIDHAWELPSDDPAKDAGFSEYMKNEKRGAKKEK